MQKMTRVLFVFICLFTLLHCDTCALAACCSPLDDCTSVCCAAPTLLPTETPSIQPPGVFRYVPVSNLGLRRLEARRFMRESIPLRLRAPEMYSRALLRAPPAV